MPTLLAVVPAALSPAEHDALLAGQTFFTAVPLTLALLHLLLWSFERRAASNLWFALFAGSFAAAAFLDYEESLGHLDESALGAYLVVPVLVLSIARFVYSLFYDRLPRQFWLVAAACVVFLGLVVVDERTAVRLGIAIVLAVVAETLRVVVTRYRRRREDLLLPAAGMLFFAACAAGDMLIDLGVLRGAVLGTNNPYMIGAVAMLVAMSVHLARSFARTGRDLERQLARVTELSEGMLAQERAVREAEVRRRLAEAESARKDRELAEARELQLAMLPGSLPEVPGYQLAAEMTTATEVGGDYYDAHLAAGGRLVLAVGDAVGHGARAGTVVAATKGLFQALRDEAAPCEMLARIDRAIRQMQLRRVHMALVVATLEEHTLTVASAGMPSALVRRAATGEVEEIALPRVPLGSLDVPFPSRTLALAPGDLVLFASDGLAELRRVDAGGGDGGDLLGYEAAREALRQAPAGSAREAVEALSALVRRRLGGAPPADDITLLALRRAG